MSETWVPSNHYLYTGFSFSSEDSAIGHMKKAQCLQNTEHLWWRAHSAAAHWSDVQGQRREQWELLHHCSRTLCPGREAQPQHRGLFNIILSCGDTTISCQAYRRQWYSLALRSIFPGHKPPSWLQVGVWFFVLWICSEISTFFRYINRERRKNCWPGTGEIWQELRQEIFPLPAGLYLHKHLSFPTVRNTFTEYSLITCTAWDKSDTKQCLSFSSLPIPCKTKSGT